MIEQLVSSRLQAKKREDICPKTLTAGQETPRSHDTRKSNIQVSWGATLCRLANNSRCFEGAWYLHPQGQAILWNYLPKDTESRPTRLAYPGCENLRPRDTIPPTAESPSNGNVPYVSTGWEFLH